MAGALALLLVVARSNKTDIFAAVRKDSPELIQRAIDEGEDVNAVGYGRQSPLLHAAIHDKQEALRFLVQAGADTNTADRDGRTILHGAAERGNSAVVQLLLDLGLDPNDRHSDGLTPIHRACLGREPEHTETVRVLLKAGVPAGGSSSGALAASKAREPSCAWLHAHSCWAVRASRAVAASSSSCFFRTCACHSFVCSSSLRVAVSSRVRSFSISAARSAATRASSSSGVSGGGGGGGGGTAPSGASSCGGGSSLKRFIRTRRRACSRACISSSTFSRSSSSVSTFCVTKIGFLPSAVFCSAGTPAFSSARRSATTSGSESTQSSVVAPESSVIERPCGWLAVSRRRKATAVPEPRGVSGAPVVAHDM